MILVIRLFPGGRIPSCNINGAIIIAAGRSLSTNISSTEKFLVIAKRVPTKKAAQIDTVIIAAKYPKSFAFNRELNLRLLTKATTTVSASSVSHLLLTSTNSHLL